MKMKSPEGTSAAASEESELEASRAKEATDLVREGAVLKPDGRGGLRVEVTDQQIKWAQVERMVEPIIETMRKGNELVADDIKSFAQALVNHWKENPKYPPSGQDVYLYLMFFDGHRSKDLSMEDYGLRAQEIIGNILRLWRMGRFGLSTHYFGEVKRESEDAEISPKDITALELVRWMKAALMDRCYDIVMHDAKGNSRHECMSCPSSELRASGIRREIYGDGYNNKEY